MIGKQDVLAAIISQQPMPVPGPQGDPGPQGPKGDRGDRGEKGDRGPEGRTGKAGPQGERGATGAKGDKGDRGATGATGRDGVQGPRGEKGERGERGPAGASALDMYMGGGGGTAIRRDGVQLDVGTVDFVGEAFAVTVVNQVAIVEALATGGPGGSSAVADITTDETDTTLVLAPDGNGGLGFRAEPTITPDGIGAAETVHTHDYDTAGTAAAAVAAHAGASDPHPGYLTPAEGDAAYQPLDSDLTAIAALTTTTFGRALLALADQAALLAAAGAATSGHTHLAWEDLF